MPFSPIRTERLVLRAPEPADAPRIQQLAGDWEVARTLAVMPHPYEDGMAESWIAQARDGIDRGEAYHLAVVVRQSQHYIGGMGLEPDVEGRAVLGYWIGRPYWNQGYAREAAKALVDFGFDTLGLVRIVANAMPENVASTKLLGGLGCACRGRKMQEFPARGETREVAVFELTRADYEARRDG